MTSLGVVDPRGMGQARNGHLEPRTRGRSPWGGHECAFWGVPGRFALAHSMPGLCLSTPHVYSTYMACADQLMDAGRCTLYGARVRKKGRGGTQASQSGGATITGTHQTYGLPAGRTAARWQSTRSQG